MIYGNNATGHQSYSQHLYWSPSRPPVAVQLLSLRRCMEYGC